VKGTPVGVDPTFSASAEAGIAAAASAATAAAARMSVLIRIALPPVAGFDPAVARPARRCSGTPEWFHRYEIGIIGRVWQAFFTYMKPDPA
jgi:hypothetical protein